MVVVVSGGTVLLSCGILLLGYWMHPLAGCAVEAVMTYQILALKCLKVESMKVYEQLAAKDLPGARTYLSSAKKHSIWSLTNTGLSTFEL